MFWLSAHCPPMRWLAKKVFWEWEWIPLGKWGPHVLGLTIGRKPLAAPADDPGASPGSQGTAAPRPRE